MDEQNQGQSVCIICNESPTSNKGLVNNQQMIDGLVSCNERLSLGDGQSDIKELTDRLASLSDWTEMCLLS